MLTQIAGIFNIFVGLMLVAAFLLYFGALVGWFIRRGAYPSHRDDMIRLMQWAVVTLFILVVLLALIHIVQVYRAAAAFVVGLVIFFLVVWLILKASATPPKKDAER